jgi:hypothetical protein
MQQSYIEPWKLPSESRKGEKWKTHFLGGTIPKQILCDHLTALMLPNWFGSYFLIHFYHRVRGPRE